MPKKATKQTADEVAQIDVQIQAVIAEIDARLKVLEGKKATLVSLLGASHVAPAGKPLAAKVSAGTIATVTEKKRVVSEATKKKLKVSAAARWARERAEKAQKSV